VPDALVSFRTSSQVPSSSLASVNTTPKISFPSFLRASFTLSACTTGIEASSSIWPNDRASCGYGVTKSTLESIDPFLWYFLRLNYFHGNSVIKGGKFHYNFRFVYSNLGLTPTKAAEYVLG